MMILIHALVAVSVIRLGIVTLPSCDLVGVDDDVVVLHPRREHSQPFIVVVGRDAGRNAVVPAMHTTDQILAGHVAVGHEGATVKTSAVEHSDFVIGAHDY